MIETAFDNSDSCRPGRGSIGSELGSVGEDGEGEPKEGGGAGTDGSDGGSWHILDQEPQPPPRKRGGSPANGWAEFLPNITILSRHNVTLISKLLPTLTLGSRLLPIIIQARPMPIMQEPRREPQLVTDKNMNKGALSQNLGRLLQFNDLDTCRLFKTIVNYNT